LLQLIPSLTNQKAMALMALVLVQEQVLGLLLLCQTVSG
jgi:hypothetical protein